MVPFLDLQRSFDALRPEIEAAVATSLASGRYIGGPEVTGFEDAFARYTGAAHCIGVGNGLDAIRLVLDALGIGAGDEVLVPSNTYIATWLAVSQCGATPVPVEPDPVTHNVTAAGLEAALTPRTRALIPVHLYGCPAPIDDIVALAGAKGLFVIEDAAQAHGARWKGDRIGHHGHAATWSFYPGKNLGAFGDGGAVTTDDPDLAARIRLLGNYGSHERYVHDVQGVNSRLDPVQAAILSVKLAHLDAWNARRGDIAARYTDAFAETGLTLPAPPKVADPVWHLYVLRHSDRRHLQDWLSQQGIQTLIHYPCPPHKQAAYATGAVLPIAETLADQVLSLPIGPQMTDSEVTRVIEAVTAYPGV